MGQAVRREGPGDHQGELGGLLVTDVREGRKAHGHALDAANGRFEGGRDGARVDDVRAEVGPAVDAREDHVGKLFEQGADGELDAVRRGAVDRVCGLDLAAEIVLLDPQGLVQRQGVTGGRALAIRGDHRHLVLGGQGQGHGPDAGGVDPVVVGNKNAHRWCPFLDRQGFRAHGGAHYKDSGQVRGLQPASLRAALTFSQLRPSRAVELLARLGII
ncbi:hypothetical protein D3C86_1421990 [compost metagenome]